jgi:hypothetical protein
LLVRQTRESGRVSALFYQWLFIRSHNETLSASQDRAGIVFDCRMASDPAMMSATVETNTSSHHFCRPALVDVCAAQRTRPSPVFGLCPRAVLHHARSSRPKAACVTDDHHRRCRRCGRKCVSTPGEKLSGITHVYEVRPPKDKRGGHALGSTVIRGMIGASTIAILALD